MTEKTVDIPVRYIEKTARLVTVLSTILPPCELLEAEVREIVGCLNRVAMTACSPGAATSQIDIDMESLCDALDDAITRAYVLLDPH